MVDEEQGDHSCGSSKPARKADDAVNEGQIWDVDKLKQKITQVRKSQHEEYLEFEEKQQRLQQEFNEYQNSQLQHLAQLEEKRANTAHSAIPQLRLDLEQADLLLADLEAEEDALNLEVIRMDRHRACEEQEWKLACEPDAAFATQGELPQLNAKNINTAFDRVCDTIQHFSKLQERGNGMTNMPGTCNKLPVNSHASYCDGSADKENQMVLQAVDNGMKLSPQVGPRRFGALIQSVAPPFGQSLDAAVLPQGLVHSRISPKRRRSSSPAVARVVSTVAAVSSQRTGSPIGTRPNTSGILVVEPARNPALYVRSTTPSRTSSIPCRSSSWKLSPRAHMVAMPAGISSPVRRTSIAVRDPSDG
jgi:hypothetical protein